MKLAAVCLFSALYTAASTLASDLQPTIPSVSEEAAPEPTGLTAEHYEVLEVRQAAHDPNVGGVDVPTQFPTVTTDWRPTLVGGVKTWYPDIYTQTFAKVPDQLPSPGVGQIGLGNLSKKNGKRAAEATPTGAVATGIAGRYRV